MATQELEEARAETFAGPMLDALDAAFVTLMTSVGYRTRPFDTTHDQAQPRKVLHPFSALQCMTVSLALAQAEGDISNNSFVATAS